MGSTKHAAWIAPGASVGREVEGGAEFVPANARRDAGDPGERSVAAQAWRYPKRHVPEGPERGPHPSQDRWDVLEIRGVHIDGRLPRDRETGTVCVPSGDRAEAGAGSIRSPRVLEEG